MPKNYGSISGKPRIKVGYGQSMGKVQTNIRRKTASGGFKMKKIGYGK